MDFKRRFSSVVFPLILAYHSAFLQEFRNWESAWAMKALHSIAYELRSIAEMVGSLVQPKIQAAFSTVQLDWCTSFLLVPCQDNGSLCLK